MAKNEFIDGEMYLVTRFSPSADREVTTICEFKAELFHPGRFVRTEKAMKLYSPEMLQDMTDAGFRPNQFTTARNGDIRKIERWRPPVLLGLLSLKRR